jgi:hypothetical protein
MPLLSDTKQNFHNPYVNMYDYSTPTFGEVAKATFTESWEEAPTSSIGRALTLSQSDRDFTADLGNVSVEGDMISVEPQYKPTLSEDEWNNRTHKDKPISALGLKYKEGHSADYWDIVAGWKDEENQRKDILAKAKNSWGESAMLLGVGFTAQLIDPVNLASAFIPVGKMVGFSRYTTEAGVATTAGLDAYKAARVGGALPSVAAATAIKELPIKTAGIRAAEGFIEGSVGNLATEAITYNQAMEQQSDYTLGEVLQNLAFGGAVGSLAHTMVGIRGALHAKRAALDAIEKNRLVDVVDFVDDGRRAFERKQFLTEVEKNPARSEFLNKYATDKGLDVASPEVKFYASIVDEMVFRAKSKGYITNVDDFYNHKGAEVIGQYHTSKADLELLYQFKDKIGENIDNLTRPLKEGIEERAKFTKAAMGKPEAKIEDVLDVFLKDYSKEIDTKLGRLKEGLTLDANRVAEYEPQIKDLEATKIRIQEYNTAREHYNNISKDLDGAYAELKKPRTPGDEYRGVLEERVMSLQQSLVDASRVLNKTIYEKAGTKNSLADTMFELSKVLERDKSGNLAQTKFGEMMSEQIKAQDELSKAYRSQEMARLKEVRRNAWRQINEIEKTLGDMEYKYKGGVDELYKVLDETIPNIQNALAYTDTLNLSYQLAKPIANIMFHLDLPNFRLLTDVLKGKYIDPDKWSPAQVADFGKLLQKYLDEGTIYSKRLRDAIDNSMDIVSATYNKLKENGFKLPDGTDVRVSDNTKKIFDNHDQSGITRKVGERTENFAKAAGPQNGFDGVHTHTDPTADVDATDMIRVDVRKRFYEMLDAKDINGMPIFNKQDRIYVEQQTMKIRARYERDKQVLNDFAKERETHTGDATNRTIKERMEANIKRMEDDLKKRELAGEDVSDLRNSLSVFQDEKYTSQKFVDDIQKRFDGLTKSGMTVSDAKKFLEEEMKLNAKQQQAANVINAIKYGEVMDRIAKAAAAGKITEAEALMNELIGGREHYAGARDSVDIRAKGYNRWYLGRMLQEFEDAQVWHLVDGTRSKYPSLGGMLAGDKGFQLKIMKELYSIDLKTGLATLRADADAVKAAEIIHKISKELVDKQNALGANINMIEGYISRHSHDRDKLLYNGDNAKNLLERTFLDKAGRAKLIEVAQKDWIDFIKQHLDMEKTFRNKPEEEINKTLAEIYDSITGGATYKKGYDSDFSREYNFHFPMVEGAQTLGEKLSRHRVLTFKDAEHWQIYDAKYGRGDLMDAVYDSVNSAGRNIALMERFGPDPEGVFNKVRNVLTTRKAGVPELARVMDTSFTNKLEHAFAEVDGSANIPSDVNIARYGRAFRAWQNITKLGGAMLSSLPDMITVAEELIYQGMPILNAYGNAFANLRYMVKSGSSAGEKEVARMMGVGLDGMIGDFVSRFADSSDMGSFTSKMMNLGFKINLLDQWTDAHKFGMGLALSNHVAGYTEHTWDALEKANPKLKRALTDYGIDNNKWNIIREGALVERDGNAYIMPGLLEKADDALFIKYAGKELGLGTLTAEGPGLGKAGSLDTYLGKTMSNDDLAKIAGYKQDLIVNLKSYFVDRTDHSVPTPGIRQRMMMRAGTRSGDVPGEFMRSFWQFKSFPLTLVQENLGQAYREKDFAALSRLFVGLTAMGYVSLTAKDFLQGREPRELNGKTFRDSFIQGGAGGLYADFLNSAGENRYGQGPLASFLGPTYGAVADAAKYGTEIYKTTFGDKTTEDLGAKTLFMMKRHAMPYYNTWYTKWALDYGMLHSAQERLSPGYLNRIENQRMKDYEQDYFAPPSRDRLRTFE